MKILWLTNYPLPEIAEEIGEEKTVNEGWLNHFSLKLRERKDNELIICSAIPAKSNITANVNGMKFYGIENENSAKYNDKLKTAFADVLKMEQPDIIHIMGSEFPHSLSMYEACDMVQCCDRCVVSLQGIISECAKVYDNGIPKKAKKSRFIWDSVIKDSINLGKLDFYSRGKYEIELLTKVKNVIGRTSWDKQVIESINNDVNYYKCNEILREIFYKNAWEYTKCEKHSIMISQATYPIKGFHFLLQAIKELSQIYPKLKVYVPSLTVYPKSMKRPSFLNSDYANYICNMIKQFQLENNICFVGRLAEKEMCELYLKSNVFVSPSIIENSSNSLGEAMLLGMPIVSSRVGGLESLMADKVEGYFYELEDIHELVQCIRSVFENQETSIEMGKKAKERAMRTHNPDINLESYYNTYEEIMYGSK